jgi:hypothetical protein
MELSHFSREHQVGRTTDKYSSYGRRFLLRAVRSGRWLLLMGSSTAPIAVGRCHADCTYRGRFRTWSGFKVSRWSSLPSHRLATEPEAGLILARSQSEPRECTTNTSCGSLLNTQAGGGSKKEDPLTYGLAA